jgi:hypothetical protein
MLIGAAPRSGTRNKSRDVYLQKKILKSSNYNTWRQGAKIDASQKSKQDPSFYDLILNYISSTSPPATMLGTSVHYAIGDNRQYATTTGYNEDRWRQEWRVAKSMRKW